MEELSIVIGIPAAVERDPSGNPVRQQVGEPYVRAVEEAGAIPVILPLTCDLDRVPSLLSLVDGVLLRGGGDVDPESYGERRRPISLGVNDEADAFEMAICRHCVEDDIPLLGICRGAQVLNVAMGGTLVQDIATERDSSVSHHQSARRETPTHRIAIEPGSRLASMLGNPEQVVNSCHHQAIDDVGEGLKVVARCPDDGIIEALEAPDRAFVVGVQFHPEETTESAPATAAVFRELVDAARSHHQRRSQPSTVRARQESDSRGTTS